MKNLFKFSCSMLFLTVVLTSCGSCNANTDKDPVKTDHATVDSNQIDTNVVDSTKIKVDSIKQSK